MSESSVQFRRPCHVPWAAIAESAEEGPGIPAAHVQTRGGHDAYDETRRDEPSYVWKRVNLVDFPTSSTLRASLSPAVETFLGTATIFSCIPGILTSPRSATTSTPFLPRSPHRQCPGLQTPTGTGGDPASGNQPFVPFFISVPCFVSCFTQKKGSTFVSSLLVLPARRIRSRGTDIQSRRGRNRRGVRCAPTEARGPKRDLPWTAIPPDRLALDRSSKSGRDEPPGPRVGCFGRSRRRQGIQA